MPRLPRITVPNVPHHVTHRGVRRLHIFDSDEDRFIYLDLMKEYIQKHNLLVLAYCLMPNHVHYVIIPKKEEDLSLAIQGAHSKYAKYFNARKRVTGHLFEFRFFSSAMENRHTYNAIRYIERNPLDAGLVSKPETYRWSSAAAHVNKAVSDPLLDETYRLRLMSEITDWRHWLGCSIEEEVAQLIERRLEKGLPVGSEEFVKRVSKKLGLELLDRPRGRPRKNV